MNVTLVLTKTHLPEILTVLICKQKIHHLLSAVYTSIYYPTLKSLSPQLSVSGRHSLCGTALWQAAFQAPGSAGALQPG